MNHYLLVRATDGQGQALAVRREPALSEGLAWATPRNATALGYLARRATRFCGNSGRKLANRANWKPTRVVSDNRLAAFATDGSTNTCAAPAGKATVQVRLLYRRPSTRWPIRRAGLLWTLSWPGRYSKFVPVADGMATVDGVTPYTKTYKRLWGEPRYQIQDVWLEKGRTIYVWSCKASRLPSTKPGETSI